MNGARVGDGLAWRTNSNIQVDNSISDFNVEGDAKKMAMAIIEKAGLPMVGDDMLGAVGDIKEQLLNVLQGHSRSDNSRVQKFPEAKTLLTVQLVLQSGNDQGKCCSCGGHKQSTNIKASVIVMVAEDDFTYGVCADWLNTKIFHNSGPENLAENLQLSN